MLVDTHCHLDASEFDADRDAVVDRAVAGGVARIVVPAVGAFDFDAVRALSERHDTVRYALGIHPMFVDRAVDADLDVLRRAVAASVGDPRFAGIGEVGLDHFVPGLDRARMEHFFVEQLRIAVAFGLPVILHVRRSQDAVLKQLRRFRPVGGIAHAFNGSAQQAAAFAGLGFALGFGGAMTYPRALQIRRLAASVPLDAVVLETDAPDIAPEWRWRGRNEPAELPRIAAVFADLRGMAIEDAIAATGANAVRVLPALAR
ncbi:MAG: TatD family deoxyribonuclease [Burkholderiales bacterium]|nr:MAG: TatD family deoxyribonuclease [Burkholderiales bacterium]